MCRKPFAESMKSLSLRLIPALVSLLLIAFLYWGLSQAESRAIYASWDKWLHAAVFFLIWWLMRWSVRFSSLWVTVLVVAGGGAEEIHQLWQLGHVASWGDWLADIAGIGVALTLYLIGRLLWLLRESVAEREASELTPDLAQSQLREWGQHDVDFRWTLSLWRWNYYFVFLAGHNRRELSLREQAVARWGVIFLTVLFLLVGAAVGLVVVYTLKVALGV